MTEGEDILMLLSADDNDYIVPIHLVMTSTDGIIKNFPLNVILEHNSFNVSSITFPEFLIEM